MNVLLQRNFVRAGAAGALVAFLALIALALVPRPTFPVDDFSILSGVESLSPTQLAAYQGYVADTNIVDSLYLLGHIVMWLGYAALVSRESLGVAGLIAGLGLLSGGLDFTENEMRWAALKALLGGTALPIVRIADWHTVFGLSFWVLFLCALVAGVAVARRSRLGTGVVAMAAVGIFVAPLMYKLGFLPAFLWIILWHALSVAFLWQQRLCVPAAET